MNRRYLSFALIAASIWIMLSCEKKRTRIFDDSPSVRLELSVNEVYARLLGSANGWRLAYYPGINQEFGGYTLFAQFTSGNTVSLWGDYEPLFLPAERQSQDVETSYRVYAGAGPILTFDTYNSVIHYFALPGQQFSNPTAIGTVDGGYRGDFEFLVLHATADSILLQGRKTANRVLMVALGAETLSAELQRHRAAVARFYAFESYRLEVLGKHYETSFPNRFTRRCFIVAGLNNLFSYRFTPQGIAFYKPYEIEGVPFQTLDYSAATADYPLGTFSNKDATVRVVPLR